MISTFFRLPRRVGRKCSSERSFDSPEPRYWPVHARHLPVFRQPCPGTSVGELSGRNIYSFFRTSCKNFYEAHKKFGVVDFFKTILYAFCVKQRKNRPLGGFTRRLRLFGLFLWTAFAGFLRALLFAVLAVFPGLFAFLAGFAAFLSLFLAFLFLVAGLLAALFRLFLAVPASFLRTLCAEAYAEQGCCGQCHHLFHVRLFYGFVQSVAGGPVLSVCCFRVLLQRYD